MSASVELEVADDAPTRVIAYAGKFRASNGYHLHVEVPATGETITMDVARDAVMASTITPLHSSATGNVMKARFRVHRREGDDRDLELSVVLPPRSGVAVLDCFDRSIGREHALTVMLVQSTD
jgi:hypothetical protein